MASGRWAYVITKTRFDAERADGCCCGADESFIAAPHTPRKWLLSGICGSCAMNIDGANWLACTRFIADTGEPATIYPLANMEIIKDLVPDLTHLFAQYAMIEPWLQAKTPEPERERLQSPQERSRVDGYYECILCFCCTS